MKIKEKTVSDKVNELLAKEYESSDDSLVEDDTTARITEFDEDEYEQPEPQSTEFRKRSIKLLSEQNKKYRGKISSRKDFENDNDDDDEEEDDDDDEEEDNFYEESDESNNDIDFQTNEESNDEDEKIKIFKNKLKQKIQTNKNIESDDEENEDVDEENEEEEDIDDEEENIDESDEEEESDIENNEPIISEKNRQTEIQKGICVQNQLHIWERLLEFRINTQKILNKSNQLPPPTEFNQIPNIDEAKQETCNNLAKLLGKLSELQQVLIKQNPDVHSNVKIAKKPLVNILEDESAFTKQLAENFDDFRTYRNNVLLKWHDRTKLLTPGIGSKRKATQEDYDVVKKIEHALTNTPALIARSQVIHNPQTTSGEKSTEPVAPQPHIYDDSDFYHQQLRELIEYKANANNNLSEVTRQYIELQKLRQKIKKKVDTRASKGRKIRYVVHKKLVNFMAPEDNSTWTEESKNELYKSLFAA